MIDDGKCGVTLGYQAHLFFLFRHGGYLLPFYDVILVRHFTFVVFTPFRTLHLFSFFFSKQNKCQLLSIRKRWNIPRIPITIRPYSSSIKIW